MSDNRPPEIGSIGWLDLTVDEAEQVRDFYAAVVGWQPSPVDMGGYSDFNMQSPGRGQAVAGVCHARGINADLPPVWLVYFVVEDLDHSIQECLDRGGKVIAGPKEMGGQGRYCVLQDPAGAIAALWSQAPTRQPPEPD